MLTTYKVKDLMVKNPEVIEQDRTLTEACEAMARIDCGIMLVGKPHALVGMVSDRDVAVRAIAKGKDPAKTKISEIMTNKVLAISEDASLEQAAEMINTQKVNRLVVKDSKGRLTGILSMSGLIRETADKQAIAQFVHGLAHINHKKAA